MPDALYKQFQVTHPEYDPHYWCRCRALYAGGKKLLRSHVMRDIFPPHLVERDDVYQERCRRAYYINYAGAIIDSIVAELFGERLALTSEPKADAWYDEFIDDCSPPGGKRKPLNQYLKEVMLTALQTQHSWTLVDLPRLGEDIPSSLADQERMGGLNAYLCGVEPESVRDWEETEDGELVWALLAFQHSKRMGLDQSRDSITEEFVLYTVNECVKYQITYDPRKPPEDNTVVPEVSRTPLSFGKVPLVHLKLTDGLYAMGKLESIAAAHMNKRNALSWAEYKSLFPTLTHFQGPPNPVQPQSEDPNRATNQTRGQGYVTRLPADDRLEWSGPSAEPFTAAAADLASLRDEMYRVVQQMAQSVDNSAAALQRSAESKTMDRAATVIVLKALAQYVIEHVREVLALVGKGRGDPEVEWTVKGMEVFDSAVGVGTLLEQAETLENVSIPSATFNRKVKFLLAKRILGDDVTDDDLKDIEKELEESITGEMYEAGKRLAMAAKQPPKPGEEQDNEMPDDMPMKGKPPMMGKQMPQKGKGKAA